MIIVHKQFFYNDATWHLIIRGQKSQDHMLRTF